MASSNVPCPHVIGSTVNNRTLGPSQLVRISCKNSNSSRNSNAIRSGQTSSQLLVEGPSCLFIGPIDSATQETLEALYRQARDAYYSGKPLILDDMFDRVEEDPSQVFALASVWLLFLGIGSSACLMPVMYTLGQAVKDALDSGFSSGNQAPVLQFIAMLNGMLVMMLGSMIGYPVVTASVGALQGLWKNDLVALKGACPNCGEEVFAFVKSNKLSNSPHKAECHVCECLLEFRTKVERSVAGPEKRWVYGRIYLIRRRRMNRGQRWT